LQSTLTIANFREMIDPRLTAHFGFPDSPTLSAFHDIVTEAVADVLGPRVTEAISPTNAEELFLLAPWAWDLSRGLHYRAECGSDEPKSIELLIRFAGSTIEVERAHEIANSLDIAVVLTIDQTIDHIHGIGATKLDPEELRVKTPWLGTCLLGVRLRVLLEFLRLGDMM
jgi:hypothetical protein